MEHGQRVVQVAMRVFEALQGQFFKAHAIILAYRALERLHNRSSTHPPMKGANVVPLSIGETWNSALNWGM